MFQKFFHIGVVFFSIWIVLITIVWVGTFHPPFLKSVKVHCVSKEVPFLSKKKSFKILTWNVQYFAGKNYIFFYDLPNWNGPDLRPSALDIRLTLKGIAHVLKEENPDFVLLQEVDQGAKRTDGQDQWKELQKWLPKGLQKCFVEAFYWKSAFLLHPKIMGSVGMKLVIFSRYRLRNAVRIQLPLMPGSWIYQQFNFKRAVLKVDVPFLEGGSLKILNTHLDAFTQGTDTLNKQVRQIDQVLTKIQKRKQPWVLGGDFNALPPLRKALNMLPPFEQGLYASRSPLTGLFQKYSVIPSIKDLNQKDADLWNTHFPNHPQAKGPTKVIDYLFYSPLLNRISARIRRNDTLSLSDHLPMVGRFRVAQ